MDGLLEVAGIVIDDSYGSFPNSLRKQHQQVIGLHLNFLLFGQMRTMVLEYLPSFTPKITQM